MHPISREKIDAALATVQDPEIHRPITELGMVKSVEIDDDGTVTVCVLLTVAGCPMREEIISRVSQAVSGVPGVTNVNVILEAMTDEQRAGLKEKLQGPTRVNPFTRPGNTTKIIAVASGKGGVGKSSLTANLAIALARSGLSVALVDADIYGHSIPGILGVTDPPTVVEGMLMPPESFGVRFISMLPFKPGGAHQAVAFRGPMLHRALEQFLTDVYWGDPDVLLLDLPPGTGDIAISVGQLLPRAELLIVTTPQQASTDVAIRAGMLAQQTHQRVAGVVENMSTAPCPHCGEPLDLFGSGGGALVAQALTRELGTRVDLIGKIPFDVRLREGGDAGLPLMISNPDHPTSLAISAIADVIAAKPRGLAGISLGLTPAGR
ncbi:MAG: Mrp/NBP35 family ATP-binding protein [Actinomycetes bacterium]